MGETRQERIARLQSTILGYRADGRPIYPIAGGSGEDDGGDGGDPGTGTGSAGGDGGTGSTEGGTGDGGGSGDGGDPGTGSTEGDGGGGRSIDELPEWAQREIRAARRGEGDKRTKLRTVEQELGQYKAIVDALKKALDPDSAGEDDPAKVAERVQAERDEKERELRESRIELAVYRAAGGLGGDADALLDSKSFLAQVSKLDPEAEDFSAELQAAIKQAVEKNPKLRVQSQVPTRSGSEFTGGSGEKSDSTSGGPEAFRARIRKARGLPT